jgi:hypothetical protein
MRDGMARFITPPLQTGAKGIADNSSVGLLTSKAACSPIKPDKPGSNPRRATNAVAMVPQYPLPCAKLEREQ